MLGGISMDYQLLIVDDSLMMREGLKVLIKRSGKWKNIHTASNGKEGIEKILENNPDIVTLDLEMPVMDGFETLKSINQLKQGGKISTSLPVVVLSGLAYNNNQKVKEIMDLGASLVIPKPEGKSTTVKIQTNELENKLLSLL